MHWSSQEVEKATEMDLPSRSICLQACGLIIVFLYLHSVEELHPFEKLCRKGNL